MSIPILGRGLASALRRFPYFLSRSALIWALALIALVLPVVQGCSVKSEMMHHLSSTLLNNNDLEMVESGAPAYLLMIDSLISQDPGSVGMLTTASQLYTAYADLFVTDPGRSKKLATKAMTYAENAFCLARKEACGLKEKPFEAFETIIASMDRADLDFLFTLGHAWASWIMANPDDFNALADISRIEAIMARVVQIDETYKDGAAYLYLASLATFLPPALGGRPEQGRAWFEKAMALSRGKSLMPGVIYAKRYARMVFDRELHDQLLTDVMTADPEVPGYTLINTYAQEQARILLQGADDYF